MKVVVVYTRIENYEIKQDRKLRFRIIKNRKNLSFDVEFGMNVDFINFFK